LKILILGYSNLARRRIINFFLSKKIKFSVASISFKKKISGAYEQFYSYNDALKNSNADIVYISLPNSLHFYWAKKSLNMNYHVVVDKPICNNIMQAKNLINLSKKRKKLISEATFFNYHRQFKNLLKLTSKKKINLINSNFIIPFPKKGILVSRKFGGGVHMDMGPYISAIPRLFFLKKIKSKKIKITKNSNGLIISIKFIISFKDTKYSGVFMFGDEYKNEIEVFIKNKSFKIERAFSPPEEKQLLMKIKNININRNLKINKDNCFSNFFKEVMFNIKNKNFNFYHKNIIQDCYFRNKILR